jgi:hypothetical protein
MRKLLWCGVTGLAVAAGGYHAMRHARAWPDSVGGNPTVAVESNFVRHTDPEDVACPAAHCVERCPLHAPDSPDEGLFASASASSEPASRTANGEIELQGSAGASSAVIYVPTGEEPPLALTQDTTESTADLSPARVPAVMPYCEDEEETLVTMPYAADDPWPATKSGNGPVSPGWFEEAEPDAPATVPECREDDNLSRQYPGLAPSGNPQPGNAPKKAAPWHHEGEPFLPVLPDSGADVAPAKGQKGNRQSGIPLADWWVGSATQALESVHLAPGGLRKHVSMKILFGRDSESAARQPVDTLEARPSDLPKAEPEHQPF